MPEHPPIPRLGRDFWLFRLGQVISVIGDSCNSIALAWWILDSTGSALAMSTVLAPTMFTRTLLLPLFGPIGDRFDRKKLILLSDLSRGLLILALALLSRFHIFNLPALVGIYILTAIATAMFSAASAGILPQLVSKSQVERAYSEFQAIGSTGTILGGVTGGLIVTALGASGAFTVDATSFFIAALATWMIRADTRPAKMPEVDSIVSFARSWSLELKEGFRMMFGIPVLFWLAVIAMGLNFVLNPMAIALPVIAKEAQGMPPWFLGALEGSVGVGSIAGSLLYTRFSGILSKDNAILLGLALIGASVASLPLGHHAAAPLTLMFLMGLGAAITNNPSNALILVAIPAEYRSRLNSIMSFLCQCAGPLGVALAGGLMSQIGISRTLECMGIGCLLMTPLILLIPNFSEFFRSSPEEAERFITGRLFALNSPPQLGTPPV